LTQAGDWERILNLREKLTKELLVAPWKDIRPHFEAGRVYVVSEDLELIEVAVRMVDDDVTQIQSWIISGQITPPNEIQIRSFDQSPEKTFSLLIVQPYVLLQERAH